MSTVKDPMGEFIEALRTPSTVRSYKWGLNWISNDPNRLLRLAKRNRREAETLVIDFIKRERGRVAPATLRDPIAALKSFLDYNEVNLNWKRIRTLIPPARKAANDRAPSKAEVRKLLSVCDIRMKAVVLILTSCGMRVGGFDGLKLKHFVTLESGIGRIRVYSGETQEYWAFLSHECVATLKDYFKSRERIGEELGPESPLIRDTWTFEKRRQKLDPTIAQPLTSKAISNHIGLLWVKAGVREFNSEEKYKRGEFQQVHGFRKFFETTGVRAGINRDDIEVLKSKITSYYKPTLEYLEEEYQRAEPYLTIGESAEMKHNMEEQDKRHKDDFRDLRLELLERDKQIAILAKKMERIEFVSELKGGILEDQGIEVREKKRKGKEFTEFTFGK